MPLLTGASSTSIPHSRNAAWSRFTRSGEFVNRCRYASELRRASAASDGRCMSRTRESRLSGSVRESVPAVCANPLENARRFVAHDALAPTQVWFDEPAPVTEGLRGQELVAQALRQHACRSGFSRSHRRGSLVHSVSRYSRAAMRLARSPRPSAPNTPTWQLSCFPRRPLPCRATPTD
jgi:hypothetical protein